MKKNYFFLLCIFMQISLMAQTKYSASVLVIDQKTKEPLTGVTLRIDGNGATTDLEGKAIVTFYDTGKVKIQASYIGYDTQIKVVSIDEIVTNQIEFQLVEAENILNTVTVTSGKFEKPLGEVTVSMDVIRPRLLESNNAVQVDKALDKVPGVSIIGSQANIRGGSGFTYGAGSRVLILVDDIPALQADAGIANWNDYAIENMEQIEVIKGAASALYGSSAMNGIVNLRTAYAKDKPTTSFSTFYTAFMTPKDASKKWWSAAPFQTGLSFSHKRKFRKTDLIVSGFGQKFNSFNQDTYDNYGRITVGIRHRITDKLSIGFNSNSNVGESSNFYYWLNGKEGAYKGTTSTITSSKKTRIMVDPFVTYFDKNGSRHKLLSRLMYIKNNNALNTSNQSFLTYGEYQFQHNFVPQQMVVTAGVVGIYNTIKASLYNDTSYSTRNLSAYVQADKKFGTRLNVSFGARYEQNSTKSPVYILQYKNAFGTKYDTIPNGKINESRPVFRLGLNYQVAKYTFIRASFGEGYRFPTIAEKFISTNLGTLPIVPNGRLESETGYTTEIGIKQGFKIGGFSAFFDASVFQNVYKNMMEFVFVREFPVRFQSQNIGNTRIVGTEFSVAGFGKIKSTNVSLLTGYTYILPKFETFGQRELDDSSADFNVLKYRFKHTVKFDLEAENRGVIVGVSVNHNSKMEAIDRIFNEAIPGVKAYRAANNKGVTLVDFRVGYNLNDKYRLTIIGKNLTNEEYTLRPALLEAPRNITARLDLRF